MGEIENIRVGGSDNQSLVSQGIVPEALLAVAFISPEREKAISTYLERIETRRRRRVFDFEQEVLKQTQFSPEELLRRLLEDEAASKLFEGAVLEAVATAEERKRQALARAVAAGLLADDRARLDISDIQMRTIAALEPAHLRLLMELHKARSDKQNQRQVFSWAGAALDPMLSELQGRGLIVARPADDTGEISQPRITPFGRSLLKLLEDTGEGNGS
jgi:hypothetical protein